MANSFLSLHVHVVFSTKNRERWIHENIENELWSYMAGIIRTHGGKALQIGGMEDHIHILMMIPATIALSDFIKRIKGESSKWLSQSYTEMRGFHWQDGYGAFSIGQSQIPQTITYIQNQKEHHRQNTFEQEYKSFLEKHGISYNEKFALG